MINCEPILISDNKVCKIPIIENNDPIIDIRQQKEISYFARSGFNLDYTKVRKTVYDKLVKAQNNLPKGLRLCVYEGYRNLTTQDMLFQRRFKQNSRLHKNLSFKEIFNETVKLVSPVRHMDGTPNIPPHSTGGAIDLYLIDDAGNYVDMGLHPKNAASDSDGSIILTNSQLISDTAKIHRKVLSTVMINAGFVNYFTEYWHWSYGDRYWAYHKRVGHAIYSSIEYVSKIIN